MPPIDVAAYALLKRGITANGSSGIAPGPSVLDARLEENGDLILILGDGTELNCGTLIDDAITSVGRTWSSARIESYTRETVENYLNEQMPNVIFGGNSIDTIVGGSANSNEADLIYGMDADEEPVGVKFHDENS